MSEARVRILAAGPQTSVQDRGRPGWQRFGVSPSGPVDRLSFEAALSALGDCSGGLALELSGGGITIMCEGGPLGFALCGPGFTAEVDGAHPGGWAVGMLEPGSRLVVRAGGGNWGYLAFAGRLRVPHWLGSAATHLGSGLGGGAIAAGLELAVSDCRPVPCRALPLPRQDAPIEVARAVLGPQDRFFDASVQARLVEEPFRATQRMDRMGMVLDGPRLVPLRLDMPSEAIVRGALQADGEGRVTLLLADHQTTGGYPRVATLLSGDADRVAQLPPGAAFRISLVSPARAVAIVRAERARQQDFLAGLATDEPLEARLMRHNLITARVEPEA
jgi:biotin-dependent carboxylase-like uncharacterized protein